MRLVFLFVLCLAKFNSFYCAVKPWEPEESTSKRAQLEHESFVNQTKQYAQVIKAVFIGDSITNLFDGEVFHQYYGTSVENGVHAVKYGISGERTENVIWRIQNGEFQGLHPTIIVIMIGTNNIPGNTNDTEISIGITAVVEELRKQCENATILLMGILPRGDHEEYAPRIKNINEIISLLEDKKSIYFLNMETNFSTVDNKIKENLYHVDKLHPNKDGYKVWAETMNPLFSLILKGENP